MDKGLRGAGECYSRFDVAPFPLCAMPHSVKPFRNNRKQAITPQKLEKHLHLQTREVYGVYPASNKHNQYLSIRLVSISRFSSETSVGSV
jgi:hypothetical protein